MAGGTTAQRQFSEPSDVRESATPEQQDAKSMKLHTTGAAESSSEREVTARVRASVEGERKPVEDQTDEDARIHTHTDSNGSRTAPRSGMRSSDVSSPSVTDAEARKPTVTPDITQGGVGKDSDVVCLFGDVNIHTN